MAAQVLDVGSVRSLAHHGDVTFLPADPPRAGSFALWGPPPPGQPRAAVELILPGADRIPARRSVAAYLLPLPAAIPWLAQGRGQAAPSLLAWRACVRGGLRLVAGGRLRPGLSASGLDAWLAGPLDADDEALMEVLAEALPAGGHAVPVAEGDGRVRTPRLLIRACWDAIADAMPRTAAAQDAWGGPLYSGRPAADASHLRPHFAPAAAAAEPITLRVATTEEGEQLLVEAARPDAYATRVRLGVAARRVPALGALLGPGPREPSGAWLEELAAAAPMLAPLRVRVELPLVEELELRAVIGSETATGAPVFSLDALLDFRWELAAGSQILTAAEVEELARSQARLVRVHDRWFSVNPDLLKAAAGRPRAGLRAGEALAAALTGTVHLGGRMLPARAVGTLEQFRERVREMAGPREEAEPEGLEATLRGYQRRGLAWLRDLTDAGLGACLADDMGLGKTVQLIALHLARRGGPALVICPTSVLGNWERELRAFAPGVPVRRFHGGQRGLARLAPTEVVLTTYGVLRRDHSLTEMEWDLAVADEAQQVKNPASVGARQLRRLSARARVALTGTPVENRLLDLWSILDWTTPGLLGSREAFQAWAGQVQRAEGASVEDRLRRLTQALVLRRRKTDPQVAPELPAKTEMDHVVPLAREQVGLYEAVVRETMAAIRNTEGMRRRGLVLKLLTSLKQICNHPAQYLRQEGPLRGRSGKLEALDDLLEVILEEGDSTLVFTQYTAMGRLLERHLAGRCKTAFLHGGVPVGRREEMVRRFQAAELPVFLVSLRAGGFGLNLTRATHVIHFDRWWNPAVEDQATDRAHRIGQDHPVQVHRLLTEGTVEDRISALLEQKRSLAARIVGGGEGWVSELSDEELADLVRLQAAS